MQNYFENENLLWLLMLLPIIVAIYFYAIVKKKKVYKQLGDEHLIKQLLLQYNATSYLRKFLLLFFSLSFLLFAITNFRTKIGEQNIKRNGIDIMIALDVSKSMLANDVKPNRLDRAKQLLYNLIEKLENDRIGIIVFAGKAYLQMPLTADHSAAKMYLSAATPATIPIQGTVIGDALLSCNAVFNAAEKKYKSIILLSDGEDHDEKAEGVAEQLAKEGVVINTVGIGSTEGVQLLDEGTGQPKLDEKGGPIITKLNEQTLENIAKKGNGTYQLLSNTNDVSNALYNSLSTLDTKRVKDGSLIKYFSWFQYLLGAALLLLVIELFISENKKMTKALILLSLFGFNFSADAQTRNNIISKANNFYNNNNFVDAIKNYGIAIDKNSKDGIAYFNQGNAYYKVNNTDNAIKAFDNAALNLITTNEKSNALYNKGVVLQQNKKLEECIAAYKTSLKLDPKNEDARHNLQLALQKKQEQQKENKDGKKKDKKQKDDSKNDKEKPKKDEQNNPKPSPSNITRKEAEQQLQVLEQKEKELQDKLHRVNATSPNKLEKDW